MITNENFGHCRSYEKRRAACGCESSPWRAGVIGGANGKRYVNGNG